MRIKEGYILRKILNEYIVLSYGLRAKEDTRMITLTESATILWKAMEKDVSINELIEVMSSEFPDIPEKTIAIDVLSFVDKLRNGNYLTKEK